MIDENYHIEDIDDIFDNQDDFVKEVSAESQPVRARVVFEDSSDKESKKEEVQPNIGQDYDQVYNVQEESINHGGEKRKPLINNTKKNTLWEKLEAMLLAAHRKKPNTLIATIVGIIIAILFLWIGFLKTAVICIVVFIANIIGQIFDQNPVVVGLVETIVRKFK